MINAIPLACCRAEIENLGLAPPDDAALIAVIETDQELVAQLNEYYTGDGESGLDTAEREWLLDVVAIHFTKRAWPANMEANDAATEFMQDLTAAAMDADWL
jgi:hypothetical protein